MQPLAKKSFTVPFERPAFEQTGEGERLRGRERNDLVDRDLNATQPNGNLTCKTTSGEATLFRLGELGRGNSVQKKRRSESTAELR